MQQGLYQRSRAPFQAEKTQQGVGPKAEVATPFRTSISINAERAKVFGSSTLYVPIHLPAITREFALALRRETGPAL